MEATELLLVQSWGKAMPRGAARSDGDSQWGLALGAGRSDIQPRADATAPNAGATPPVRKAHVKSPSKAPRCLI